MPRVLIISLFLYASVFAIEAVNWDKPSRELLQQDVCPIDSMADAMVVQKETAFNIIYSGNSYPYLYVVSKKRIKIYTEKGLEYSEFKEYYDRTRKIKSIEAYCYRPNGTAGTLSKKDIHEELILKDNKRNIKYKAKSFALPGVTPGCVIDIYIESVYEDILSPPVYRYHESIPVSFARFMIIVPPYFFYKTLLNNPQLIEYEQIKSELTEIGETKGKAIYICDGSNIPAIENEAYKPPVRNLATDLWMAFTNYDDGYDKIDIALTWESLLKNYPKAFNKAIKKSKKRAKPVADSLRAITDNTDDLINMAYEIVRDRWANSGFAGVGGPSDKVDKMMEWNALDSEDKSTILCAILKYLDIKSEVVWVCTDDSDYSPLNNFPCRRMFDYALTYIPSKSLYLDVADPGGQPGILDVALSKRLQCRPMILNDDTVSGGIISITPEFEKISGYVVDIKLNITEDNNLEGQGKAIYYNQSALEIRRTFKSSSDEDKKEIINDLLFRDNDNTVTSYQLSADSVQSAEQFQVEFEIKIEDYLDSDTDFETLIYPGPTFNNTTIDYKPPRLYPILFSSNNTIVYNVEWNYGNNYHLLNTSELQFNESNGLLHYTLSTDYDESNNRLSVRRQYRRSNSIFQPTFSTSIEKLWQKAREHDLVSVFLEEK